jgi:uncharacterized protein YbjT (DUF2867 family)
MFTITGATGKTGSVVAMHLLEHDLPVRVIGRSAVRLETLHQKGAEIVVGDQGDVKFLTEAFSGSDAVYLLIPPKFDAEDFRMYYNTLGDAAITAIKQSGVKRVVFLSSLGADKTAGTGPVVGLHDVEQKLRKLEDVDIVFLRPGYFMENTLGTLDLIHSKGINGGPMPPDIPVSMVATADIGAKAAELLMNRSFKGHTVVEIVGDRVTFAEVTALIGTSIGMLNLPYIPFSDADAEAAFLAMGLSASVARSYIELMHGIAEGLVGTIADDIDALSAPTRFSQFVEEILRPAFMALEHPAMA